MAFLLAEKKRRGLKFGGFPILDDKDRLVGMISGKDLRYADRGSEKLAAVMTKATVTAAPGTSLEEAYKIMREHKIGKLPLVDKDGRLAGLYSYTDVQQLIENQNPAYNRDSKHRLRVPASVSGGTGDYSRIERLAQEEVDVVVADPAHRHTQGILDMVSWIA